MTPNPPDVDALPRLRAERDALSARIKLIEDGVRKAAYDGSIRTQLYVINESRRFDGKRPLSKGEFMSGVFDD